MHPVPPLLACWWVGFLLFLTLELVAWVVLIGIDSAGERRLAYGLRLVADASAAISASLAYFVVVKITDAQDEKHERFGGGEDAVSLTSRDAIASGG